MQVLDNLRLIAERDPFGALDVAARQAQQLIDSLTVQQSLPSVGEIRNIVLAGMGGSALAAGIAKDWLDLPLPFEVVRNYSLPKYVGNQTLVIASSHSGNTEETLAALDQAVERGALIAIIASGGALLERAQADGLPYVQIVGDVQPRMALFSNLRALVTLLEAYGIIGGVLGELEAVGQRLGRTAAQWRADVPATDNHAKQIALQLVGKTPVIYASNLMRSVAYKWKISFNENAKNIAFCNALPEFNHNEFIGWSSHPVQKPFGVIDLLSSYDHPRVQRRFELSARLLSGKRPQPIAVQLEGETMLEQMAWAALLADYTSIYLAILNGVEPTKVELVERLKHELRD